MAWLMTPSWASPSQKHAPGCVASVQVISVWSLNTSTHQMSWTKAELHSCYVSSTTSLTHYLIPIPCYVWCDPCPLLHCLPCPIYPPFTHDQTNGKSWTDFAGHCAELYSKAPFCNFCGSMDLCTALSRLSRFTWFCWWIWIKTSQSAMIYDNPNIFRGRGNSEVQPWLPSTMAYLTLSKMVPYIAMPGKFVPVGTK